MPLSPGRGGTRLSRGSQKSIAYQTINSTYVQTSVPLYFTPIVDDFVPLLEPLEVFIQVVENPDPVGCFNITILDDDAAEPPEDFLVELVFSTPPATLDPNVTTVIILDNDGLYM